MRRYEILLPLKPNHGGDYLPNTRRAFLSSVAAVAGGYTLCPATEGFWRDPDSGKEYVEAMQPLQVAVDPDALVLILGAFREYFPDQKSIMVTDTGESAFYPGHDAAFG